MAIKTRAKYTSKGERRANKKLSNAVRRDRSPTDVMLAKIDAYYKGKKVWITVPNPNPNETNKRFIKVLASSLWGDPKERKYAFKIEKHGK